MIDFTPSKPEGATVHTCETCAGEGYLENDDLCPGCDGTGEWFE